MRAAKLGCDRDKRGGEDGSHTRLQTETLKGRMRRGTAMDGDGPGEHRCKAAEGGRSLYFDGGERGRFIGRGVF